jgi:hypothetical protein
MATTRNKGENSCQKSETKVTVMGLKEWLLQKKSSEKTGKPIKMTKKK